jgi:hypothetical protein
MPIGWLRILYHDSVNLGSSPVCRVCRYIGKLSGTVQDEWGNRLASLIAQMQSAYPGVVVVLQSGPWTSTAFVAQQQRVVTGATTPVVRGVKRIVMQLSHSLSGCAKHAGPSDNVELAAVTLPQLWQAVRGAGNTVCTLS